MHKPDGRIWDSSEIRTQGYSRSHPEPMSGRARQVGRQAQKRLRTLKASGTADSVIAFPSQAVVCGERVTMWPGDCTESCWPKEMLHIVNPAFCCQELESLEPSLLSSRFCRDQQLLGPVLGLSQWGQVWEHSHKAFVARFAFRTVQARDWELVCRRCKEAHLLQTAWLGCHKVFTSATTAKNDSLTKFLCLSPPLASLWVLLHEERVWSRFRCVSILLHRRDVQTWLLQPLTRVLLSESRTSWKQGYCNKYE